MFKGFKEFVLRGNVIDLAVAVVIGAAFSGIVSALVNSLFNPLIGSLFNAEDLKSAFIVELPSVSGGEPAQLAFGAVLAAVIQFLLVAVVVYFALVMPINRLSKLAFAKKQAGEEVVQDAPPTELELLTEIRDLLANAPAGGRPADPAS